MGPGLLNEIDQKPVVHAQKCTHSIVCRYMYARTHTIEIPMVCVLSRWRVFVRANVQTL
jgi:hypothetical protein